MIARNSRRSSQRCVLLLAPMLLLLLLHANHVQSASFLDDIYIPGWDTIDWLANDWLPSYLGQAGNNQNGTASEFKEFALKTEDEIDLNWMNLQELIERAGFKQTTYKAVADDGYVTSLTRIINPLADKSKLKWPPVLLLHGGTIDPTAYVFSSTNMHHPEVYPRKPSDGPITSYNRSLALMLSNNGHDVWLAETRGSNENNMDHIHVDTITNALNLRKGHYKNMTEGESLQSMLNTFNYWGFSEDDIIEHEIRSYIDKICQVVSAEANLDTVDDCKVNFFSFSLSTPLALGFLSTRPDYAKDKIHRVIIMAPTFYRDDQTSFLRTVLTRLCPLVPNELGVLMVYELIFGQLRKMLILPGNWKKLRYTGVKAVSTLLMGPSAKYRTLLEMNVLHHIMRAVGFKQAKQMCQQMRANRLQKYDYGEHKNLRVYNSTSPPEYDISNLLIKPYLLVVASNDAIGPPAAVKRLIKTMNPKPERIIVAPEYNHLDLVAGVENDKYVNLPILEYLNQVAVSRFAKAGELAHKLHEKNDALNDGSDDDDDDDDDQADDDVGNEKGNTSKPNMNVLNGNVQKPQQQNFKQPTKQKTYTLPNKDKSSFQAIKQQTSTA